MFNLWLNPIMPTDLMPSSFLRIGRWLTGIVCLPLVAAFASDGFPAPGESKLVHFGNALPHVTNPAAGVDYQFHLSQESFEIFMPKNFRNDGTFGLFVFMSPGDRMSLPTDWVAVLERRRLLCVLPQNIGNNQPFSRRVGLTYVGLLQTVEHFQLNPKRIYTGGLSGGARCALQLAFLHNDAIAGNIGVCGANFYEAVPRVKATNTDTNYGIWPIPPKCLAAAKARVKFVFITGAKDFRYGNILDIYHGGFEQNGFQAKLVDVPGMGHELCGRDSLEAAFRFIESK